MNWHRERCGASEIDDFYEGKAKASSDRLLIAAAAIGLGIFTDWTIIEKKLLSNFEQNAGLESQSVTLKS